MQILQKSLACFFAVFFGCFAASAQTPVLLKDINTAIASTHPTGMTNVNNTVFFSAADGAHGRELWKTTGTEASTVLVKDINTSGDANPANFCNVGGIVFFAATTAGNGTELWRSNGTAEGTFMVKDINAGPVSSEPIQLTACDGKVFFRAKRVVGAITQNILFVSDGTADGTTIVEADDSPFGPLIDPESLTAIGERLFLSANMGTLGRELWEVNSPIMLVRIVNNLTPAPNVSSNPRNLVNVGGILFFCAEQTGFGRQIHKFTPGQPSILQRFTDMQTPGASGINALEMVHVNGTVFFTAIFDAPNSARQLFRLNSAALGGASKITNALHVQSLTAVGNTLFFVQAQPGVAPILFSMASNAPLPNNVKTFNLIPFGEYPAPKDLINVNGTLFFTAATLETGRELWRSSATTATPIQNFMPGNVSALITNLCARGSDLFFSSIGADGFELRKSNGAVDGIKTVRDIGQSGSFPKEFVKMGAFTYFSADDGSTGRELWKTDGNTGGTQRVADIISGPEGSNPTNLIVVTTPAGVQTLFFVAKSQNNGRELYKLENTVNAVPTRISDIIVGAGDAGIGNLTNVNGRLHFTASSGLAGFNRIFRTDATRTVVEAVTGNLSSANNLTAMGSTLFFTQSPQIGGPQLCKLVNSTVTTVRTFSIINGGEYPIPQQLTVVGTRLFFTAADGATSRRVWVTNTAANSASVVSPHNALELTNFNGRLVYTAPSNLPGLNSIFRVNTLINGVDLLVTGSSINTLRAANATLFFFQALLGGGVELSKITTANINIPLTLKQFPIGNSGILTEAIVAGNNLFFNMTNAGTGNELWKSNGTINGTVPVSDIRPNIGNSNIQSLRVCGTDLFFSADNLTNGQEPWKLANATALQGDVGGDRDEISEAMVAPDAAMPEIRVYPNPTSNFVNVDLPQNDLTGTLSILSASGQLVRSVQSSEGEMSIQIDVQDLPKGVYLVRWVQSDDQVVVKKLIVQ